MKKTIFVSLMILALAGFAAAQQYGNGGVTSDVLGAHLNYGRGCAACHAPHSGAYGNGAAKKFDAAAGDVALWGQDVASLYGQTLVFGGGGYTESLPTSLSGTRHPCAQAGPEALRCRGPRVLCASADHGLGVLWPLLSDC